jgi:hypothetical protein
MKNLIKIQAELKCPKGSFNAFGKYKYRSAEQILEALKPLLNKYDSLLLMSDSIVEIGNKLFLKATATFKHEGESIEVFGFAEMGEHKGMSSEQTTGTASSYARKYALNGLFLIDETESDPDSKAPTPKKKETITDERLQAALEKIKKGEYTMEKLKEKFELTPKQLELCM